MHGSLLDGFRSERGQISATTAPSLLFRDMLNLISVLTTADRRLDWVIVDGNVRGCIGLYHGRKIILLVCGLIGVS